MIKNRDLTKLENQLALFCPSNNQIYKLASIDYRGERFDVSGERYTRWIHFSNGVLFNFVNELDKYYDLYKLSNHRSKEYLYNWLIRDDSRSGIQLIEKSISPTTKLLKEGENPNKK